MRNFTFKPVDPMVIWPGPFVPRSDHSGLAKAVYLNCSYCHQLFARNLARTINSASARFVCSAACAASQTHSLRLPGRRIKVRMLGFRPL